MRPKINILSVKALYLFPIEQAERAAVIVCSSYRIKEEKLSYLPNLLTMNFDDTINADNPRAFSPAHAKQVRLFIDGLDSDITDLYICCDRGESRSTALAAAIMRYYRMDETPMWTNPHYHPNALVYRLQCAAFKKIVTGIGLRYRLWCNKIILRLTIRAARKQKTVEF